MPSSAIESTLALVARVVVYGVHCSSQPRAVACTPGIHAHTTARKLEHVARMLRGHHQNTDASIDSGVYTQFSAVPRGGVGVTSELHLRTSLPAPPKFTTVPHNTIAPWDVGYSSHTPQNPTGCECGSS
uniref:Uncharacterized protein n=1 Tax=Lygus hesperus TaxID=30085 RepID=A0A146KR21_LYGHE